MRILFARRAWDDYLFWQASDAAVLARLNALIKDASRSPFRGLGKPEALGGDLSGLWSRRIDHEHRLIYRVTGRGEAQTLEIVACRFHYDRR